MDENWLKVGDRVRTDDFAEEDGEVVALYDLVAVVGDSQNAARRHRMATVKFADGRIEEHLIVGLAKMIEDVVRA